MEKIAVIWLSMGGEPKQMIDHLEAARLFGFMAHKKKNISSRAEG